MNKETYMNFRRYFHDEQEMAQWFLMNYKEKDFSEWIRNINGVMDYGTNQWFIKEEVDRHSFYKIA